MEIYEEFNSEDNEIKWDKLDAFVGEPVYQRDKTYDGYRVLKGYKRFGDNRYVMFTDGKGEIPFDNIKLFPRRPQGSISERDLQ